jgi:hypothetical protein
MILEALDVPRGVAGSIADLLPLCTLGIQFKAIARREEESVTSGGCLM